MILRISGLHKTFRHAWTYRRIPVLTDLSLEVREGEIFGLIGPNGAGKTTTFKCLLGFLRPTLGRVEFAGAPLTPASRRQIGFLPEQPYFYDHLTVRETLRFYGRLYGMSGAALNARIEALASDLRFDQKLSSPLRTLSKGNLQRVGVAQAILHRPRLAILDEPMSGLDPSGRRLMREIILDLKQQGTTIIFSSHILSDTEVLCDRAGILTNGSLREVVDVKADGAATGYRMVVKDAPAHLADTLRQLAMRTEIGNGGQAYLIADYSGVRAATEAVHQAGAQIESLVPAHPSLEERFLRHAAQLHQAD